MEDSSYGEGQIGQTVRWEGHLEPVEEKRIRHRVVDRDAPPRKREIDQVAGAIASEEDEPMGRGWGTDSMLPGGIMANEEYESQEESSPMEIDEPWKLAVDTVPDLHEYFSRYKITAASKVGLCRSYANYIAKTFIDFEKK